jgi:hypothetical protein
MSFFTFVAQYYVERLRVYEQLDLTRCSAAQLLDVAGEASALHKFLTDIVEEGYTATVDRFVGQTDALTRLQQFLSTALHVLGPQQNAHALRIRISVRPGPVGRRELEDAMPP